MSGNFAKKDELVAVVVSPGISAASWVHLTLPEPNPLTSSVSLSSVHSLCSSAWSGTFGRSDASGNTAREEEKKRQI